MQTKQAHAAIGLPRSDAPDFSAARAVLIACLLVMMFLWPSELPIAMAMHGLARPILGDWYGLLLHSMALSVVAFAVVAVGSWRTSEFAADWRLLLVAVFLYVCVGALALPISSIEPVETRFAYQQLMCGYIAPVVALAALLTLDRNQQLRMWTWFYAGWIAFLLMTLVLLRVSWLRAGEFSPAWEEIPFLQRVVLWRYSLGEPWNIYGLVVGNSNKMSNYLIIFLLFSPTLLRQRGQVQGVRSVLLAAFWILAVITLLMLFSRAALLLLPLVAILSGIGKGVRKGVVISGVVAALAGVGAIYVIEPRVFEYLLLARIFDDADASPLGTFVDRFAQWHALLDYFAANPSAALHGLGTSGYGMMFFNSNEAGTHNLFLDLWAESGIIAPLLFVACLAVALLGIVTARRTPRERGLLAVGLVMLVLLMTREHSVSYLYVTSMGGLCFAVILYLAVRAETEERA